MKCNHAVELFDSYLKGNATQEEKTALENHIATCETCKKQFDLYRFYFADVKIENDFPVPSQLNAKIKYTIHRAKGKKKVPFWQNKQVLSFATACTFMLVAGIWGISHYAELQNHANTPVTETVAPAVSPEEQIPEPSPVTPVTPVAPVEGRKTPDPNTPVASTNPAALTQTTITPEKQPQVPAYSGDMADMETDNAGRIAYHRPIVPEYDVALAAQFQETILSQFPNEVLTDDTYLVTVTKAQLEKILGCSTDAAEDKDQLVVKFIVTEE